MKANITPYITPFCLAFALSWYFFANTFPSLNNLDAKCVHHGIPVIQPILQSMNDPIVVMLITSKKGAEQIDGKKSPD